MITATRKTEVFNIREARMSDAAQILCIYAPFVLDTAVSFEASVPDEKDFRCRMSRIIESYPYYVCECDGKVIGYAYAARHREREAYKFSAETSVYILPEFHRRGIGRSLYRRLFDSLSERGCHTALAAITLPNQSSVALHSALGFHRVGIFHNVGFKLGAWHDVIWMEKALSDYDIP